jgi:N-acetylmuramoyl-L-alanine amidase
MVVVFSPADWMDLGYSFLVGGDGQVYEGRGWNHSGAHTYGYNSRGVGKDTCIQS